MTDREGKQICIKLNLGKCQGACPNGFSHLCKICLQPHVGCQPQPQWSANANKGKAAGKGKGGKAKGGKGWSA